MGTLTPCQSAVAPAAICHSRCSAVASLLHPPVSPALGQPDDGSRRDPIWLKTEPTKTGWFSPEEDPAFLCFMKKGSRHDHSRARSPADSVSFPTCRFKYPEALPEPSFKLSPAPCSRFWHRLVPSTKTGLAFPLRSCLVDASSSHTLN